MSANQTSVEIKNDKMIYSFENTIPIPGYLVALAVGNIEYKKIGSRTGVFSEPE